MERRFVTKLTAKYNEKMETSKSKKALRILATSGGILLSIILVCILALNTLLFVKGNSGTGDIPSILGYTPLVVQSGSMEPTINTGDLIFIKYADSSSLNADPVNGDIITYRSGNSIITHRAIDFINDEEQGLYIQTKGDANNTEDTEYISVESVLGVYTGRIPYVGDFIMFLQTPVGMLVLVILPISIILIYELLKINKRHKAENEKRKALELELEMLQTKQKEL